MEDLFNQSVKLEAMEKKAGMADSEVSALRNKLILLQENAEKQEDKLAKSSESEGPAHSHPPCHNIPHGLEPPHTRGSPKTIATIFSPTAALK